MSEFSGHIHRLVAVAAFASLSLIAACNSDTTSPATSTSFVKTILQADTAGMGASVIDTNLKNAWGIAINPNGNIWITNNHSGTSTIWNANTGMPGSLVV